MARTKRNIMKFLLTGLIIWATMIGSAVANPYKIKVLRVIDGDTLEIEARYLPPELGKKLHLRIDGIDTPEKIPRAQCDSEAVMAKRATDHTTALVNSSKKIEMDIKGWDKYGGRILGTVRVDGRDLAGSLIAAGLARAYHGEKKQSWCK